MKLYSSSLVSRHFRLSIGAAIVVASLTAGTASASAGMLPLQPYQVVDGQPTPTTNDAPAGPSPAWAGSAEPETPTPAATPSIASEPSSVAPPVPEQPDKTSTATMSEAIGPGGAEMGQRSSRVVGKKGSESGSVASEGTWMPTFGVQGLDVSGHQPSINWLQQWNMGARFAYVKASEGNYYTNPLYGSQYQGSRDVGMLRGAYHFAIPNWSSGADQARFFVNNGGGWTPDGYTLPPVLDFEFNPYEGRTINGFYFGNTCYGMSPSQLSAWVVDFGNTMQALTGRLPVIYTNTSWWRDCLGDPSGFGDYPLWVAAYPPAPTNDAGPVPSSWGTYSIWQYSSTGPFAGDSNVWNGTYEGLTAFAKNGVPPAAVRAIATLRASTPALGTQTSEVTCGLPGGGCYQGFAFGAAVWHPATGAQPSMVGPIRDAWSVTGFEGGRLGYPTSAEICGLRDGGCYQAYQRGEILYSKASGAHPSTLGEIRTRYRLGGAENGTLGYPTSAEICGLPTGGCYQSYQGGEIMWLGATGAQVTENGPIRTSYRQAGAENGVLGYPTSGKICGLRDAGCYQTYQRGEILWSPATGAYVSRAGGIRDLYRKMGAENGVLGYPTSAEICGLPTGGCYQSYQSGEIMWLGATGAQATENGPIRTTYRQSGAENGVLGYPISGKICGIRDAGCYQAFQRGEILWSASSGAQVSRSGGIRDLYRRTGAENGVLGYPMSAEICGLPTGGCYQSYQGGEIMWSGATGAQITENGPIRTTYRQSGAENGVLGYPISGKICGLRDAGCYQAFQRGEVLWSASSGAQVSRSGAIRDLYRRTGAENGALGYPTSAEICGLANGGCSQSFQRGKISWTASTGAQLG